MNNRTIISLAIVFMLSMTTSFAHGILAHDNEICDICLHIQVNDDSDDINPSKVLYPLNDNLVDVSNWQSVYASLSIDTQKFIRGPPLFS